MTAHFGFTILGSGSSGNATVLHGPEGCFLLDAGFSMKELCRRMEAMEINPCSIRALLLTHEHQDHIRGCRVFADHFRIPVYLTPDTCRDMAARHLLGEKKCLISPGSPFTLCGLRVEPFSIPHDVDATAYVFTCGERKFGFATDLGHVNMLVMQKLSGCDALVIEANHDTAMLRDSKRPLHVKRRILGRQGHLSNDSVLEALNGLLTEKTRSLTFAHLSGECNDESLLEGLASERLFQLGRADVPFRIARQSAPLETIWL